jgi:hypothetical protein
MTSTTPVLDDPRVDAAFDDFNGSQTALSFRGTQVAPVLQRHMARLTERAELVAEHDRTIPAMRGNIAARLRAHDEETPRLVESDAAKLSEGADRLTAPYIYERPTFPPKDATDAARINGILADASAYSPLVLERVARDAQARGDLPLLARLHDFIESKYEYSKVHQTLAMANVLTDMRLALRDNRVVASEAVTQWRSQVKRDVLTALLLVHDRQRPDALKVYATSGALNTLYPRPQ